MRIAIHIQCTLLLLFASPIRADTIPYFFESAGEIFGFVKEHRGRTHAWGDLDGDGLYDLVTGSDDKGLRAFLQLSPTEFERVDATNGLAQPAGVYAVLILDFDRDGDNDVFLNLGGFVDLGSESSTRLYRNGNVTGKFTDVTNSAGVSSRAPGFGLVAFDYDRDGWLDVYSVNHMAANVLFHNEQDGTFTDVTAQAGVGGFEGRLGRSTSAGAIDFDKDGWPDLFVAQRDETDATYERGNSLLLHNQGDGTFVNVAEQAGVQGWGNDFVVSVADFDNDTWPDLYVATHNLGPNGPPETDLPNRLYLNNHDGTYRDVTSSSGASYVGGCMGLAVGDHDSDGWPDIYVGTGGVFVQQIENQIFFWNRGNAIFVRATVATGLKDDARGHGSSFLDYDRDGDLDLYASLGGFTPEALRHDILYLNQGGSNHWLEIQLRGDDCNAEAVGATVTAFAGGQRWSRTVLASGGLDAQAVPHVWFGLGSMDTIDELQIRWPCGRLEMVETPTVDQHLVLQEGQQTVPAQALELRAARVTGGAVEIEGRLSYATYGLDETGGLELWRWQEQQQESQAMQVPARPLEMGSETFTLLDEFAPRDATLLYRVRWQLSRGVVVEAKVTVAATTERVFGLRSAPNPFRENVIIEADVDPGLPVRIVVYNVRGRRIRSAELWPGEQRRLSWSWDGRDERGRVVAAGRYVVELQQSNRRVSTPLSRVR
jgi:hypothetical protein